MGSKASPLVSGVGFRARAKLHDEAPRERAKRLDEGSGSLDQLFEARHIAAQDPHLHRKLLQITTALLAFAHPNSGNRMGEQHAAYAHRA